MPDVPCLLALSHDLKRTDNNNDNNSNNNNDNDRDVIDSWQIDKSTFSFCQLNQIEWLGMESQ